MHAGSPSKASLASIPAANFYSPQRPSHTQSAFPNVARPLLQFESEDETQQPPSSQRQPARVCVVVVVVVVVVVLM